ncbi:unnamed protein product [Porites evermanni]|uniref:Uncharacterized protein n=1 Tax=Porites evermanni TaxID=104178 RepID=A0ABN8T022_9CNID|nr:unnamed protein product [Porites evermanni]
MNTINNALLAASESTGFSIDKINFVFCMFLCLPLGLVFRLVLHPSQVSPTTRRVTGLAWGVALAVFCFGWESLILAGLSFICYIITAVVNPTVVHRFVFIAAMGTLSVSHLYRQTTNYGVHAVDFSGPLMLIVQRVTYIAYNLHDGLTTEKSNLTDKQKREALRRVPYVLEYFSYIFHYSTILAGPVCTFKEFNDFIDGSDIKQKVVRTAFAFLSNEPSPVVDVIKKLSSGFLCILILFLTGHDHPISRNADDQFISTQPFYRRVIYGWIGALTARLRYYFAFKVSEAVNNMCGLGFNGFDAKGKAKWDGITNVNILKVEFATNIKMACDNWNISTALWLRRIVYERCSRHRTLAVFIMSSVWHGFYPGYYMMFLSIALFIEAARMASPLCSFSCSQTSTRASQCITTKPLGTGTFIFYDLFFQGRRVIRPYFQETRALVFMYDVITCILTALSVSASALPFMLLQLRKSLDYWSTQLLHNLGSSRDDDGDGDENGKNR